MSASAKLAFVLFLVINSILWSQSRYAQVGLNQLDTGRVGVSGLLFSTARNGELDEVECAPLSFPPEEQCAHVHATCPTSPTFLSIPYLRSYFCTAPSARPAMFAGLIVWLIFLFSTLGISASDFFCPNLATLAELLGLDENVAGVTFLAFGNGSPDVFSTFSAMRAQSGSLAIGELLGAASFIVSCVVGSMCIIKPFQVNKKPFLRDVGFFTVAVTLLLFILWDGTIHAWEAWTLIGLYVIYVGFVVVGSWWEQRRYKWHTREALIRAEYAEDEIPQPSSFHEPYRDEPSSPGPTLLVPTQRIRAHSSPIPPRLGIDTQLPLRPHSRTPSPSSSPRNSVMPSFSLVGALEFRQVIASLQHQSSTNALNIFESPVTPYIGGHYHRHSFTHPRSPAAQRQTHDHEVDPWDAALGVPLNRRSPRLEVTQSLTEDTVSQPPSVHYPSDDGQRSTIPRISHTPASPVSEESVDVEPQPYSPPTRRQRVLHILRHACHVLFPTLHNFKDKSVLGMIASVLAAPAVLTLTVTLPVVVTPKGGRTVEEKNHAPEGRLVDFEEEGVERVLTAEEEVEEDMHELKFNKWLMAVQCALGPLFCVGVLFAGTEHETRLLIAVEVVSIAAAALVIFFAGRGNDPAARMARCFMGFLVAVVWIMAIADEVVNVLKTFGFIFGLSDAIIGLTIFAVGNSLADFVANISVAAFAPIMGFSACFGGPMLNILLGVGVSGAYIIHHTERAYTLNFTTTLLVSTVGLLVLLCATMAFVPWNDFFLTKRWGVFLIASYIIIMITNIVVEVKG